MDSCRNYWGKNSIFFSERYCFQRKQMSPHHKCSNSFELFHSTRLYPCKFGSKRPNNNADRIHTINNMSSHGRGWGHIQHDNSHGNQALSINLLGPFVICGSVCGVWEMDINQSKIKYMLMDINLKMPTKAILISLCS